MRPISQLESAHLGETAWIFGKGPGLDWFNASKAGRLRIAINESALHVPRPSYFFAHDARPIERVAARWPEGCRAVLQAERAELAARCGVPTDAIYCYEKCDTDENALAWTQREVALRGALYACSGTLHSALHFCRLIGAAKIVLVAMEGRGGYASKLGMKLPAGGGQAGRIRNDAIEALRSLEIPYEFRDAPADVVGCTEEEQPETVAAPT